MLEKLAQSELPSEAAVYLNFLPQEDWGHDNPTYLETLARAGLHVLDAVPALSAKLSSGEWFVSPKEGHPSAAANRVYAELLFRELMENLEHGFLGGGDELQRGGPR